MNMLNCPFCHWSRLADTSKGAPPFDVQRAFDELVEHLRTIHGIQMPGMVKMFLTNMARHVSVQLSDGREAVILEE